MEERIIEDLLDYIGVRVNLLGYDYLIRAIELKLENNNIITTHIYQIIANEKKVEARNIERAIRYIRTNIQDRIIKMFKLKYKVDNGNFIALLAREVKRKKCME